MAVATGTKTIGKYGVMTTLLIAAVTTVLLGGLDRAGAAAAPSGREALKRLDRATRFFSEQQVTILKVEKVVTSELMGKTTQSAGEIALKPGKFRWETVTPEKSLIVFDGKILWTLQPADPGLGGAPLVTRSKVNGKSRDQVLVKILAGGPLSKKFRVLESQVEGAGLVLHMAPVKKDDTVKDVSIRLSGGPSEKLEEISYVDDVGNKTRLKILDTRRSKESSAKLFRFEIPKGAEVTDL